MDIPPCPPQTRYEKLDGRPFTQRAILAEDYGTIYSARAMYGLKIMYPSMNTMMFQYSLNSSSMVLSKCRGDPEHVHVQNVEEQLHAHNTVITI